MATLREEEHRYNALFGTHVRFAIMILVLLCLTTIWSNILTLNMATLCMAPDNTTNHSIPEKDIYVFSTDESTWLISIVALTALVSNVVVVLIINRVGIRTVFTALGFLSSASTLLMPLAVRGGFSWLMAARFFQGLAFAANFPVIGAFCAKWAYFKQVGMLVSMLVAYVQLSPAITMSISGPLCSSAWGWASVFYAHGAVTFFVFVLYGLVYRNSPHSHPFVGSVEKNKIAIGKANVDKKAQRSIPYSAILRTPAVWAVWVGAAGNFGAVNLMLSFSPLYLSRVLGFSITSTGFSAALPPFAQFLMKIAFGAVSDRVHCLSETNKLRFFNSLAMVSSSTCFVILGFLDRESANLCMLALGGAAGALGAATGGFFKAGPIISQQFSHFVTGAFSILLTGTMLLVPFAVNFILGDEPTAMARWHAVFFSIAAFIMVCNALFCIFVRGDPCEWTTEEWLKRRDVAPEEGRGEEEAWGNGDSVHKF